MSRYHIERKFKIDERGTRNIDNQILTFDFCPELEAESKLPPPKPKRRRFEKVVNMDKLRKFVQEHYK